MLLMLRLLLLLRPTQRCSSRFTTSSINAFANAHRAYPTTAAPVITDIHTIMNTQSGVDIISVYPTDHHHSLALSYLPTYNLL